MVVNLPKGDPFRCGRELLDVRVAETADQLPVASAYSLLDGTLAELFRVSVRCWRMGRFATHKENRRRNAQGAAAAMFVGKERARASIARPAARCAKREDGRLLSGLQSRPSRD